MSLKLTCMKGILPFIQPLFFWQFASPIFSQILLVLLFPLTLVTSFWLTYLSSDILRRHSLQHFVVLPAPRTPTACSQCHKRKLRCDSNTPCKTCASAGTQCVRTTTGENKAVECSMSNNFDVSSTSDLPIASHSLQLSPNGIFTAFPSLHPPDPVVQSVSNIFNSQEI